MIIAIALSISARKHYHCFPPLDRKLIIFSDKNFCLKAKTYKYKISSSSIQYRIYFDNFTV